MTKKPVISTCEEEMQTNKWRKIEKKHRDTNTRTAKLNGDSEIATMWRQIKRERESARKKPDEKWANKRGRKKERKKVCE